MTLPRALFLARHGETDWNVAGRWQGHTDVPLNATGCAQAAALAERLRREGIAAVASSDLSRARTTAEIVAGALGVEVALVDRDLREQRFGRFEGLTPAECETRYPHEWARYVLDPHGGPPGGESRAVLVERVVRAVAGAAARLPSPALLVTHGGAMRALLAALPATPGGRAPGAPAKIPNGGVVRVRLAAGRPVAAEWIERPARLAAPRPSAARRPDRPALEGPTARGNPGYRAGSSIHSSPRCWQNAVGGLAMELTGNHADRRPLILVVEDDPKVLGRIASTLGTRFEVATAADGVEGLAAALAVIPDLIVTDLMMPRMTGEQLVHEVRSREELAGVPIVLLTGYSDEEMRVRVLREGALDYITKPFSTRELLSRVENFIKLKLARELLARELDCRDRDLASMAEELVARKHQLEVALEVARHERDKATRASEAKTDLLRLVSHELLTPVAALRLIGQQLERDRRSPLAPEHAARVHRMVALTDRLAADIEALLEHVRFETGGVHVLADDVDLALLAGEVLDQVRPEAVEKGLALRLVPEPGLPPVRSNRRLLRLILSSLAENAVRFTDAGAVTVAASRRERAFVVAVTDTGPGIAPEDQARVFEPFAQLEPVRHKHKPGLGLGLALAREAAAALGARIELQSAQHEGSTFTLVLPEPARAAGRDSSLPDAATCAPSGPPAGGR